MVFLSQRGEMSRPISLSLSPCLKNSSMHLAVHSLCSSHSLVGWDTSAECSNRHITSVFFTLSQQINTSYSAPLYLSVLLVLRRLVFMALI